MARTRRYDKDRSYARFDQSAPIRLLSDVAPEWHRHAQCLIEGVDPEIFFREIGRHGNAYRPAQQVCERCAVRLTCLIAGRGEVGIWGGATEQQRRNSGFLSIDHCNFDPCQNLLLPPDPHAARVRRYYCSRLCSDRARRQPRRPRAEDGTPLQPPLPTNQWTPVRGLRQRGHEGRNAAS
jgi:hypothetical protein